MVVSSCVVGVDASDRGDRGVGGLLPTRTALAYIRFACMIVVSLCHWTSFLFLGLLLLCCFASRSSESRVSATGGTGEVVARFPDFCFS